MALHAAKIQNELINLAGQISALSHGKPEDINKAEFIAGKQFVPEVDAITKYLESEKNKPLQEIKKEIADLKPIIKNIENIEVNRPLAIKSPENIPAIEFPYDEYPQIESQGPRTIQILTDNEVQILRGQEFRPEILNNEELFRQNYQDERARTVSINRELGRSKRGKNTEEKVEIQRMIDANKKYRDRLDTGNRFLTGSGLSQPCPILDQMTDRARILIGEINSGNTSLDLRNELSRLLLHLYKNDVISKSEYRSFSHLN